MGDLIWAADGLDENGLGLTRDITWGWSGPEDPGAKAEPEEVPQTPVSAPAGNGLSDAVDQQDPVEADPPEPESPQVESAGPAAVSPAPDQATITADPSVAEADSEPITYFLVDARADEIIRELDDGVVIDPAEFEGGGFSIIVKVEDELNAESVVFRLDGDRVKTESLEPYALFGDNPFTGNIFGRELPAEGEHELEATAFSKNRGRGAELAEALLTFTIGPDTANSAPVALDDAYSVSEDAVRTVTAPGVLANDRDGDGDPLRVLKVNGLRFNVGREITLESGAMLSLNSDGSFRYDPNGQFDDLDNGESVTDSFEYTVSDGRGGRSTATATITVDGITDPPAPEVIEFFLVDADNDVIFRQLRSGDRIDPDELGDRRFSIIAQVEDQVDAESVVFRLNGDRVKTESFEPYALFGDNPFTGNIFGRPLFEPGSYELEATAFSKNWGRGAEVAEATLLFTIGQAELSVAVTGIEDDSGAPGDGVTNDDTLIIGGTSSPGEAIDVFIDGGLIGSTTADAAGNWSFDHSGTPLGEGVFAITAAIGATVVSDPFQLTVDQTPPEVAVTAVEDDTGTAGDGVTSDDTLVISGTASVSSAVEVFIDGISIGTTNADAAGLWSLDHSAIPLGEGAFAVTAATQDLAGNRTVSDAFQLTVDQTPPDVVVTGVQDDTGTSGDGVTGDDTLVIGGTATASSAVEVFIDGISIGTTIADAAGLWSFDHSSVALGEGGFAITAAAQDLAGNRTVSNAFQLTVDLTPPAAPDFDLDPASDSGTLGDKTTTANPVTLTGTTDPGATVEIGGLGRSTVADGTGAFAFADVTLVEGPNDFMLVATDVAGNSSASSMTIVLEAVAASVTVTGIRDDTGTAGDGITSDDTLVIDGTTDPDRTVEVFIDGVSIGTTLADGAGLWSLDHSGTALGEGSFAITAVADGTTSDPFGITVDRTAPAVAVTGISDDSGTPDDGVTNDDTLVIDGTAEAGSQVEIFVDGTSIGLTVADANGLWSLDHSATPLGEGAFRITAEAEDTAGNTGASDPFALTIDLTAPAVPAVGLEAASDSGLAGDLVTNINPVTLVGTTDPNTTVRIESLGLATVSDGAGTFSFADLTLTEGANDLTVVATDALGNESASDITIVLDQTAPIFTIGSPANNSFLEVDARLLGTADGTGSAIASLTYDFDLGPLTPVVFDPSSGAIDQALDLATLTVGDHVLNIVGTDVAGNLGVTVVFVNLGALPPLTLAAATPAADSGEVGVTFRPEVTFSRAVDPATLTPQSLFATDPAGNPLDATIVPRLDGLGAFLFFTGPLPGASTVTVHVNGNLILAAADGLPLDADGDGIPGGEQTYSFTTVNQVPVPGTTLVGRIVDPGPDLLPGTADDVAPGADGELGTDDDVFLLPVAGATVFILGREGDAVVTDANGAFALTNVPSGNVKVAVDGRTATNAPAGTFFPEMVMDMTVRPGIENTIPGGSGTPEEQGQNQGRAEVYLPRLDESILVPVSATDPTLVLVGEAGAPELTEEQRQSLTLEVQPGSLIGENGQPVASPFIGISTVPASLVQDMLPQGLLQHTFDITIQAPDAAIFAQPAKLTLPNVFNAPPGSQLNFLSFDHTTGRLVIEGTATVSEDGLSVTTDPDTGITQPGWHGLTPPGSPAMGPDQPDDPKDNDPTPDEWEKIWSDAVADYTSAASEFGIVGEILNAIATLQRDGPALHSAVSDFVSALFAGNTLGAAKSGLDSLDKSKNIVKAGLDLVNGSAQSGTIGRITGALKTASASINLAINFIEARHDPECPNPSIDGALRELANWKALVDQTTNSISAIKNFIEGNLIGGTINVACGWIAFGKNLIDQKIAEGGASGAQPDSGPAALVQLDVAADASATSVEDMPVIDVLTPEELQELVDGANAALVELDDLNDRAAPLDLTPLAADIEAFDQVIVDLSQALGQVYVAAHGNPGDAPFLITGEGFELRGETGANGELDVFLPAGTELTLKIFDARTNSIGETSFVTEASGQSTQIPIPFYSNVDTFLDSDGDLLVDAAEEIVGTDIGLVDTDGDGVTDFVEIRNGLNPLDGIAVATGVVASLPLSGEAMEVVVQGASGISEGETALVATGSFGLAVVDVSNALNPLLRAELDLPGTSSDLALADGLGTVVVAGGSGGLHFVDVSDPANPVLISSAAIEPTQVKVIDGLAFANDGNSLKAFDVTTGAQVQDLLLGPNPVVGLALEGSTLYATDAVGTLTVIEIDGGQMLARGSLAVSLGGTRPFVGDGIVYLPTSNGFDGGYATVDVSDPDSPTLISGPANNGIANRDVALNGSGLGIFVGSLGSGLPGAILDIVNTSDPTDTGAFLSRIVLPAEAEAIAIGAGLGFVANGTAGLQVINYRALDDQGEPPTVTVTRLPDDIDPVADGLQLTEGQRVALEVSVGDDVQVRNVELLVDGSVQRNDISFPFELFADLPTIAENNDVTDVLIQVRVTDTGGNVTLSDPIEVQLLADLTPPQLMAQSIAQDEQVGSSFRTFSFTFSEALAEATVSDQSFVLIGPDGLEVHPTAVQLNFDRTVVTLTYAPLAQGDHRFEVDAALVSDLAGNPLGAGLLTTDFTVSDFSVSYIGPDGGNWFDPANWSTGEVPGAADDVLISIPGDATVTFLGGVDEIVVGRLVLDETLDIQSGRLKVTGDAELNAVLLTAGQLSLDGTATIADLQILNGTLDGLGETTITNQLVWSGSGEMAGAGRTVVAEGAAAILGDSAGGPVDLALGRLLQVAGTATLDGGNLTFGTFDNDTLTNEDGTLSILSTGRFELVGESSVFLNLGGNHAIMNAGALVKSGSGTASIFGVPLIDSGSMLVQAGTLEIAGGGASEGAATVEAGAELRFSFTDFAFEAGAAVTGDGDIVVTESAGVSVASAQALGVSGVVSVLDSADLEILVDLTIAALVLDSISAVRGLSGGGNVTVTGALDWVSGAMIGPGKTTVAVGATAVLGDPATAIQENLALARELEIAGAARLESAVLIFGSVSAAFDPTLRILAGGSFEVVDEADMIFGAQPGVSAEIRNQGTFTKSGAGETTIAALIAFNNDDILNVDQGILRILGAFADNGTTTVAPGAELVTP